MQEVFCTPTHFSQRTDFLATALCVFLRDLPGIIGISPRSMFGYRSGKYPVTAKALRKLEAAEQSAGIDPAPQTDTQVRSRVPSNSIKTIPVISWVHAGEAGNYEELPDSWQNIIPTECQDKKAFGVYLEGDSMEPKFSEGDVLIVQPSEEAHSGCLVVARFLTDGVIFRRCEMIGGVIRLIPLNERYPVTEHQPAEFSWIYPVWGRWTQIWRR
jgi:SOS-response transcriptional repressor LexA